MSVPGDGSVGLYVHVPFCERVCPYCDFAVVAARPLEPALETRYVDALLAELALRSAEHCGSRLTSVYLGGGTPSLLHPASLARILKAARENFEPAPGLEVTLEVNPSSLERERLPGFRRAGVSRLSIGIQSFDDTLLRRLGRAHKAAEGRRTLRAARQAGFANVSLDLLFAGPDATAARLDSDLDEIVDFAPEHVSVYELSVESGTPFALAEARGQLVRPEGDAVADMIGHIEQRLQTAGYERYELSNYARPGFASAHNRRYWERMPVLGIGVGAWSTDPPAEGAPHGGRRSNLRLLADYLERLERGRLPTAEVEVLDAATARGEALFLGLRRREGLLAAPFTAEFGSPPRAFFGAALDELVGGGMLIESGAGDLSLTPQGRLLADSVFAHFV